MYVFFLSAKGIPKKIGVVLLVSLPVVMMPLDDGQSILRSTQYSPTPQKARVYSKASHHHTIHNCAMSQPKECDESGKSLLDGDSLWGPVPDWAYAMIFQVSASFFSHTHTHAYNQTHS
ncbi:hypothetical protein F4778DRAFT_189798 [Xylariomycetidae sp. FL2044]|nr:hypothetical protein F4778DRAFT_189798 [Xylariomycetidae sp. FL2044]